jgi:hypothetical protein
VPGTTAPLSFAFSTTGWASGTHTLYVRAKDAAGNWTAPSAQTTVTVTAVGPIFADSFNGTTVVPPWSSLVRQNGGTASLTTTSPLEGARSLLLGLVGNARAYVTDTSPAGETSYTASFRIKTSELTTGNRTIDVFTARNTAGKNTFRVQLRTSGGVQQMRILALAGTSTLTSSWVAVPNPGNQQVTVTWGSSTSRTVTLTLDATTPVSVTVTGNTSTNRVDTVWLGASAGTGRGVSGTLMYDAFTSTR